MMIFRIPNEYYRTAGRGCKIGNTKCHFSRKKIVIENNRNSLTAYYLILIKYVVIIKRIIFHTFNYMSSYL